MKPEALIRMHTLEAVTLTTQEYEKLQSEVRGRILAQDAGIGDYILAKLLTEHEYRYHEAKAINQSR